MLNGHRNKWCWSSYLYAHRQVYLSTLIREASFAVELINPEIYDRLLNREQKLHSVQLYLRVSCHTPSSRGSGIGSGLEQIESKWMSAMKQCCLDMTTHLHTWTPNVWDCMQNNYTRLNQRKSQCVNQRKSQCEWGRISWSPTSKELLAMHGWWENRVSFLQGWRSWEAAYDLVDAPTSIYI